MKRLRIEREIKREMRSEKQIIKTVVIVSLVMAMGLTACSRKNSIDSGSDEAPGEGVASEEIPGTETTSEEVSSAETASEETQGVETLSDEAPGDEDDKIEISMEEVISIGKDEAIKYYDDLQLTNVYSYDNDYDRSIMSGEDGKREWWYVNFANEKNNYVSIMIVDGEVSHVEYFDQNGNNRLIDMNDVSMTAGEAVQKAKEYGLVGGDPDNESHWVSGYNFKLSYASLVSAPDDYRILLEVIGISPNGNFAHIDFDAVTGEVLLAEEQIENSNGDVEWKSFAQ